MKRRRPPGTGALLAIAIGASLAVAPPLRAQSRTVRGTVVDARTGEPLAGASVLVEPAPTGTASAEPATGVVRRGWSATTGPEGGYRLPGLPSGEYVLRFHRPGYRPARLRVRIDRPEGARISVGLVLEPVPMEALDVVLDVPPRSGPERGDHVGSERRALERYRRERYLSPDVRAVDRGEVIDAITLAESDLFRALQRLPGVTTRDDYTAELWTRGAPWSQTRVLFDGLPLFNPLHGAGVFSGVNSDAIDATFFHPGARPAPLAGGAAAVLDVASRLPGADPGLDGRGEVSLVSARLALDHPLQGGSGGWMLAGRRTYLDFVTWAIEALSGAKDVYVPYAFRDLTGRLDLDLGGGRSLEASALWSSDDVRGNVPDVIEGSPSRWGDLAARVTLEVPWRGVVARGTVGTSRFGARGLRRDLPGATPSEQFPVDLIQGTGIATDNRIEYWTADLRVAPAGARRSWSAGVAAVLDRQSYAGPEPDPYPDLSALEPLSTRQSLGYATVWGERRLTPLTGLELDLGLRADLGGGGRGDPALRPAPRLQVRFSPGVAGLSLSAGWSRVHQYEQVLGPAGFSVGPRLHPDELWLVAGDSVPALRSDIATVGAEAWIGEGWIGTATLYGRRVEGVTVPDPAPGPVIDRPTFVEATNRAAGVELSLRRPFGRWTTSLGYAYGRSTLEAAGVRYPAPTERRHSLDAVAAVRVGGGWRLGAAWSWASGAPYTRFFRGEFDCADWPATPCTVVRPPLTGAPSGERAPGYARLDLAADWTRDHGSWTMGAFVQVRNVLNRANAQTYRGAVPACEVEGGLCDPGRPWIDRFDDGLPILPAAGLRFTF